MAAGSGSGITVIFDFDRTIIDDDSDRWVVTQLGITELFKQLLNTMPWNSLMNRMLEEIHSQGKTTDEIAECLKTATLHPGIISAIEFAHDLGCDLRIASDSNQFYIETILKHHGIFECFSVIYTNPAFIDEQGKLRISPYHDVNSPKRLCDLCPSNMCKGSIIDLIRKSKPADPGTFIYLGDGKNDYCPCLKLEKGDYVMPRKEFRLMELISRNPMLIKAEVHEWSDGDELGINLNRIIKTISSEDHNIITSVPANASNEVISSQCKY